MKHEARTHISINRIIELTTKDPPPPYLPWKCNSLCARLNFKTKANILRCALATDVAKQQNTCEAARQYRSEINIPTNSVDPNEMSQNVAWCLVFGLIE